MLTGIEIHSEFLVSKQNQKFQFEFFSKFYAYSVSMRRLTESLAGYPENREVRRKRSVGFAREPESVVGNGTGDKGG